MSEEPERTEGLAPACPHTTGVGKDSDAWLPDQVAALAGGSAAPVRIRQAAPTDRSALVQMLARCSEQTRARRFHTYVHRFPEPYLTEALSGRQGHFTLLAQAGERDVALASCVAADRGSADRGSAEVAVLVEDSWQRAGVGTRLLSLLVAHADKCGLPRLKATVLASQCWMLRVLGGYGTCEAWLRDGVFEVTVHRKGQ